MNDVDRMAAELAAFPQVLRELLDAELAAGNALVEVGAGFPAPPAGACARLARRVTTRPRESGGGIDFYERNSSSYSGEFTDARRFYFVLEPPLPPPPPPDMDAIRAELEARQRAADADRWAMDRVEYEQQQARARQARVRPPPLPRGPSKSPGRGSGSSLVQRFRESMAINYERWHDGIGYEVGLVAQANDAERAEMEGLLLARGAKDWRDVEALAALNTPGAQRVLRTGLQSADATISMAVVEHAPWLVSEREQVDAIARSLRTARIYEGLTQTLRAVESFHPPEVVEALLRATLDREGDCAVHLAAMVMYLFGKATSTFDSDLRPFFLRFATPRGAEREAAFRELCGRIGLDARLWLEV